MNMDYYRRYYGVPAARGRTVRVRDTGKQGRITYAKSHLHIRLEEEKYSRLYHPYDVDYLVDGEWVDSGPLCERQNRWWDEFNRAANQIKLT